MESRPLEPTATTFAEMARILTATCQRLGVDAPGFRSPPRTPGADRSLVRGAAGVMVAVRLRGRPWPAVAADMVEGVVVANELTGPAAAGLRGELWRDVWEELGTASAPAVAGGGTGTSEGVPPAPSHVYSFDRTRAPAA